MAISPFFLLQKERDDAISMTVELQKQLTELQNCNKKLNKRHLTLLQDNVSKQFRIIIWQLDIRRYTLQCCDSLYAHLADGFHGARKSEGTAYGGRLTDPYYIVPVPSQNSPNILSLENKKMVLMPIHILLCAQHMHTMIW